MNNLELKAVYPDIAVAESIAKSLGAKYKWQVTQTDTYFNVAIGKLKLRQVEDSPAELIGYHKEQIENNQSSNYFIYKTDNTNGLLTVLTVTPGIDIIIKKIRTLYIWKNIRIHLDRVEHAGTFIEFEAVLDQNFTLEVSRKDIQYLTQLFLINPHNIIEFGYYEILKRNME